MAYDGLSSLNVIIALGEQRSNTLCVDTRSRDFHCIREFRFEAVEELIFTSVVNIQSLLGWGWGASAAARSEISFYHFHKSTPCFARVNAFLWTCAITAIINIFHLGNFHVDPPSVAAGTSNRSRIKNLCQLIPSWFMILFIRNGFNSLHVNRLDYLISMNNAIDQFTRDETKWWRPSVWKHLFRSKNPETHQNCE